jgi:twitching motility protein PilT
MMNPGQRQVFDENHQLDLSWTIPNGGRFRVNLFVERKGMGGVFRLIPPKIPTYLDIGLPTRCLELTEFHQGLIIVAGPSGCGKSTTLAVLVNVINEAKAAHIITLEDPVEYVYPHKSAVINQREVPKHTRSFAHALRAALREDPDAIIVGEMRDAETVSLAMTAAETGHLVIGTMHTTSGAKTIDRILAAFSPTEQQQARMMLSESLKGVVAQRLVPRADGKGQVAIFEILRHTPALSSLIREGKLLQVMSVMQTGRAHGMQTMDESLLAAVESGVVAAEDAYMIAEKKDAFADLVPPGFLDSLA